MYIVTGATGNTGSIVAKTLLEKGLPVRVVVRSEEKGDAWKGLGAEVSVAELSDKDALTKAFEGGKVLYLMNPPNYQSDDLLVETEQNIAAVQAALKNSSIEKLVVLSSAGAFLGEGTGLIQTLHKIEEAFKTVEIPVTFVRPPNFMENWSANLETVETQGVLPSFFTPLDVKFPQISVEDIGREIADAMLEKTEGVQYKELAGIPYSVEDVAEAFSKVLGREIKAVPIPEEQWMDIFRTFASERNAELNYEMFQWFKSNSPIFSNDNQIESTVTIDEYARKALSKDSAESASA